MNRNDEGMFVTDTKSDNESNAFPDDPAQDAGYRLLAARSVQKCLKAIIRQIDGVRVNEDVECVHQMRVGTRRMRAALAGFDRAFAPKKHGSWRKVIRKTTKRLGDARDCDVQILFLEAYLNRLGEDEKRFRAGVERMLLRLRQKRARLQSKVHKAMDRLEKSAVLEEMGRAARELVVDAGLHVRDERTPVVYREAYRQISMRLEALQSFDPAVRDPAKIDDLHRMRIAAKRLRYTMELFTPIFDDELKTEIKMLKKIQTLLGDIHDCDVWDDLLTSFVRDERERHEGFHGHLRGFKKIRDGIEHLRADRERERRDLYQQFIAAWDDALANDRWGAIRRRLQDAVMGGPPAPDQPISIEVMRRDGRADEKGSTRPSASPPSA